MEKNKKDEILKYLYAKIAQAQELLKEKINYDSKPFHLRESSIRLQKYAESFIKEKKEANESRIIILPGLRGTGKTTMMLQLYNFLVNEHKIPEERVLYFLATARSLGTGMPKKISPSPYSPLPVLKKRL